MPSPFPGMDPYLEGDLWTVVHSQMGAEIARQLAPQLAPRYVALTTERFVMDIPQGIAVETRDKYPDVATAPSGLPLSGSRGPTTLVTAPVRMATVIPSPVPHVNVEIRDTKKRRLVTAIEILSPTNKRVPGRRQYLRKRQRLLYSTAHLLEIDLLRKGQRVPMREPFPRAPYFVLLGRAENRPITDVWPIAFADRLPAVPVPLLAGDSDVQLDLQQTLTVIYDLVRMDLSIDYTQPPDIPLPTKAADWADNLLRAAGRRP